MTDWLLVSVYNPPPPQFGGQGRRRRRRRERKKERIGLEMRGNKEIRRKEERRGERERGKGIEWSQRRERRSKLCFLFLLILLSSFFLSIPRAQSISPAAVAAAEAAEAAAAF